VVLLGAVMMHDMAGASYISWLLPILLLLGVLAVGGIIAEVYKNKVGVSAEEIPAWKSSPRCSLLQHLAVASAPCMLDCQWTLWDEVN